MLPNALVIGEVTHALEKAAEAVGDDFRSGKIREEPDFTSQLIGQSHARLELSSLQGVDISMVVLTSHGPGAQEKQYGADLLIALNLDLPGYQVSKGVLAQAKLDGKRLDRRRLRDQCDAMLSFTPDSFVMREHEGGVSFVPASAVSAAGAVVDELREKSLADFTHDLMTSFVGDRRLGVTVDQDLDEVLEELGTRFGVIVSANSFNF